MKRILIFAFTLTSIFTAKAQNSFYNNVITLNCGLNSISDKQSTMFYGDDWKEHPPGYIKSTTPSFGLDWDYGLGDRISVGFYFKFAQTTSEKTHINPEFYYYPTFRSQAYAFGGRLLFHVFKEQKRMELYAGAGLGIVAWGHKMTPIDPYFLVDRQEVIHAQVPIFIGFRYYFSERLAGTTELSTSFMSSVNIGLSYRFSFD